jgi:3-hydroxyisobutyrate dehydrogenase and related beta-hydroxyacid dehydrogenases
MKRIGFIGVGIMGKSMVRNLMKNGYEVYIYTRTKSKIEDIIAEGAIWCENVADTAKNKDIVITIVGYPKDVEEVYLGKGGIVDNADKGTYIVDMTTTDPKLAVKINELALNKGLKSLDAPVTGGDMGAKTGTLTILVGGDEKDFSACLPVFEAMGKNINYMGKAGNGQHTKMANQIAIAGTLAADCEAIAYAQNVGLDVSDVVKAIGTGAAGSNQLNANAGKIIDGNMLPGFFIKHFIKDMKLAKKEADIKGLELPVLSKVLSMYEDMENDGKANLGTQALILKYDKNH